MKKFHSNFAKKTRQAGMTLIEIIMVLVIGALIIGGALALSSSASSSQSSTQMAADLTAIRTAVKGLYYAQGGYTTSSLNSVLIDGKKVPGTMSVSGTTISHSLGGTVTVTGATSTFSITVTNIPTDVCIAVLPALNGFTSIQVGSNTARTSFPISPTNSGSDCATASTQTIVFTAS